MTGTGRPLASIVVPGSTSNLGPGFDTLGLALSLHLTVDVLAVVEDERGEIRCTFTGIAPPGENLIATGFAAVAERVGATRLPSLVVAVSCDIPPGAGLGSSAAALVAGGHLAGLVAPGVDTQLILDTASAIEGHPDNVGASIYGGLVASMTCPDGAIRAVSIPWPADLHLVVATPEIPLATRTARAVLPSQISRADAVFNLQRTAVLLGAVTTGRYDLLREALGDCLHQPHRLALVPGLEAALRLDTEGLLGVFLSGAGPSVAAITQGQPGRVIDALRDIYTQLDLQTAVRVLDVHQPAQSVLTSASS